MSMVAAEAAATRGAATEASGARSAKGSTRGGSKSESGSASATDSRKAALAGPTPAGARRTRGGFEPSSGSTERSRPKPVQYTRAARQFAAPEMKNYQGIILVEFILAELLVAATPIATRQNQPGLSPYIPRDMTKLLAIGLVYFLLELGAVAGNSWGRFGAWFGGLILLTVGLNEGANIVKTLDIFGLQTKAAAKKQNPGPSVQLA